MVDLIRIIIKRLAADERAATAIEYGLIVALVALGALGAFAALGESLRDLWGYVDSNVNAVIASSP